jgi:hypothetical protein
VHNFFGFEMRSLLFGVMVVKLFDLCRGQLILYDDGLSDLELLVQTVRDMAPKDPSWTNETVPCSWMGVGCDSNSMVTSIAWTVMELSGTINFDSLPPGLEFMDLSHNQFSGVPPLYYANWPPAFKVLDLSFNFLTGDPDITAFPEGMLEVHLNNNLFDFTPSLNTLPATLQTLDLSFNAFCGKANFPGVTSLWCPSFLTTNLCGQSSLNATVSCDSIGSLICPNTCKCDTKNGGC